MRVLKILGWIFAPYIMILIMWKSLSNNMRVIGITWSIIVLFGVVLNKNETKTMETVVEPTKIVETTTPTPKTAEKSVLSDVKANDEKRNFIEKQRLIETDTQRQYNKAIQALTEYKSGKQDSKATYSLVNSMELVLTDNLNLLESSEDLDDDQIFINEKLITTVNNRRNVCQIIKQYLDLKEEILISGQVWEDTNGAISKYQEEWLEALTVYEHSIG